MARSKVVYYGTTLMDITDTTAVASDVAVGKYFYTADGVKTEGTSSGGGTIIVTETEDPHGGTVVEITGEEIHLQSKTATPTTQTQSIRPDTNYHGLSSVTVNPIPSEYIIPSGTKTITSNGTEDVTQYASVTVNVSSSEPTLQTKTITPTKSTQTVTPESGYDGLSSVTVNPIPSEYIIPNLRSESVTPTESSQTITPGSGYDGLSEVTVGAISSTYVGSGITQRSGSDLTASGATVTVPAGYYASQVSKSVATGTEGTPTATKGTVSNNSLTVTPSVTNTAGYISGGTHSGTGVTVTASELVSGTKTITENGTGIDVTNYASVDVNVQPSHTATISGSGDLNQEYVTFDGVKYYTDGDTFVFKAGSSLNMRCTYGNTNQIKVDGVVVAGGSYQVVNSYDYTLPDYDIEISFYTSLGTSEIKVVKPSNVNLQTKSVSYTPTKSTQTETVTADSGYDGLNSVSITVSPIPSQYITTTDATATASDINSGETAYVNGVKVTGTQVIQTYYTGTANPSSSTGSDGDIYLKVVS